MKTEEKELQEKIESLQRDKAELITWKTDTPRDSPLQGMIKTELFYLNIKITTAKRKQSKLTATN